LHLSQLKFIVIFIVFVLDSILHTRYSILFRLDTQYSFNVIRYTLYDIQFYGGQVSKKLYYNKKINNGFTLVELMVVVAIIGVLALMGLRVYSTQQDKSKDAIVKANVSTVHTHIQTELADEEVEDVWDNIDQIILNCGIHIPEGTRQEENINGSTTESPDESGNGGKVFVRLNDGSNPTVFYINGVNTKETGYIYESPLEAK
jgi:prepilin-type N-terminal cleavage/methylation domain-containing protein